MPSESAPNRDRWNGLERRVITFRPLTALTLLSGMLIILIVGWRSYRTTSELIDSSSWIKHTEEVLNNVDELLYRLQRAEAAQSRYIVTADERFLTSYHDDVRTARTLHERLLKLTADNKDQQQRLRDLRRLMDAKIQHMDSVVEQRRTSGITPELEQRLVGEGKRRMDELQARVADVSAAETGLLALRTDQQRLSAERSLRSIVAGGGLALLFLAIAGLALQRDMRKRFAIERRLQSTTALQRAVLNSANYAIISTNVDGTIVTFNAAAEQMFGYHSSEVLHKLTPVDLFGKAEMERFAEKISRFFEKPIQPGLDALTAKAKIGTRDESQWLYTRRDGSQFHGLLSTTAMHDEDGAITGYVFVISDVTLRHQAEAAKSQLERRYRAILQNSSDMVCIIDPAGRLQYVSPAVERLLGFKVDQIAGREMFDIIHPGDIDVAQHALEEMATHPGYSTPLQLRLRKANGEALIAEIVANNLLHDEVLHGIVLNARDISERTRARSQLEVQNAVARVLAAAESLDQSIPEILEVLCNKLDWELSEYWGVDGDSEVLVFNFAWSLPGFDLREFLDISQHTRIRLGEGLAGRVWEHGTAINVPDISHEEKFVRRAEVEALSLKTAVGFPLRSREAVIGVFTLFSLRPRYVDDDLLSMLNTVGAQIGQFIARKRAEQQIKDNEDRYRYLFENSADLILTFAPNGALLHLNAAWMHAFAYSRDELMKMTLFDLVSPEERDHCKTVIEDAVTNGSLDKVELTFRTHDGRQIIAEGGINCRYGDSGEVEYCNAIFQDATKRREVDRMKNEFISVVSHELRTPLTSIRGSLGLLAGGALRKDPDKAERMLDIALKNTERLVRLINDILDIEKIESGKIALDIQPIDSADLVSQAVATMHAMAETNHVKLDAHPARGTVFADRDRMLQTLTNLLSNAIKFSRPGSTVGVTSEKRGAGLLIRVRDQGRGIPSHKLQTIFERFQQVDASDSRDKGGTGLGLAICRSIVQQHGGAIWVDSAEGKGSEFFVLLPRFQPENAGALQARNSGELSSHS